MLHLNVAIEEKSTVDGNELHTFMTRSTNNTSYTTRPLRLYTVSNVRSVCYRKFFFGSVISVTEMSVQRGFLAILVILVTLDQRCPEFSGERPTRANVCVKFRQNRFGFAGVFRAIVDRTPD